MALAKTPPVLALPDPTQLPESKGTFVKNVQEYPQSLWLIRWTPQCWSSLILMDSLRLAVRLRELGLDPDDLDLAP